MVTLRAASFVGRASAPTVSAGAAGAVRAAVGRRGREGNGVHHPVEWRTPAPLWDAAIADADGRALFRPVVLRFAGDDFMDRFLEVVQNSPEKLPDFVARPETWRDEQSGWLPSNDARWRQMAYKLYQPAHMRFYIVAADLVCRIPGLPSRTVDAAADERVSLLVRRLAPVEPGGEVDPNDPATYVEEAWGGAEHGWRALADPGTVGDDGTFIEERHPLFGVTFTMNGLKRRVLAAVLPVASRETYAASGPSSPIVPPGSHPQEGDPRIAQFEGRVQRSLLALFGASTTGEQAAEVSTFILYDFAELLHDHLPAVWALVTERVASGQGPIDEPANARERLADYLLRETIRGSGTETTTWADGLVEVWEGREALLAGAEDAPSVRIEPSHVTSSDVATLRARFDAAVAELGPYEPPEGTTGLEGAPTLPMLDADAGALYTVRCVYERPHCGGLHPPVVSEPARPFQLASHFDPDAPTRPVRIALPGDTSIAGLRKFKRDVSFFASKQLRTQMERLRGLRMSDLEDGPPAGTPFDLGMVCTLSIPIITICAVILLMIILQMLNIIFWWLPFVKICFPIRR